jgi:hypothetical protein
MSFDFCPSSWAWEEKRLIFPPIVKFLQVEAESSSWNWTSPLPSILIPTTTGRKIVLWFLCAISTGFVVAALRAHRMRQRVLRFNLNGSSALFQSAGIREKRLVEEAGWWTTLELIRLSLFLVCNSTFPPWWDKRVVYTNSVYSIRYS